MPTRIKPMIKLAFVVKYCSDQSQTERHKKTTAKSPTIYAHLSFLLWFLIAFGLVASAMLYHHEVSIFVMLPDLSLRSAESKIVMPTALAQ